MDGLLQDVRFAFRSLGRNPGLVVVIVLSLGLGIGATTTMYSLVSAMLLRPMSAERPQELAAVYVSDSSGEPWGSASYPEFRDYRERTRALADLAAYTLMPLAITRDGHSTRVLGSLVSGNYFPMLGQPAARGRTLQPADDAEGAAPAAYLSHGAWQRHFAADPEIVGSTVTVNGHAVEIVGVAGPAMKGAVMGLTPDVWLAARQMALARPSDAGDLVNRGGRSFLLLGRLAPGATPASAQAEMNVHAAELGRRYPASDSGRRISVLAERDARLFPSIKLPVLAFLAMLLAVGALVLAVAGANVAGLMLARGVARRHEIGMRLALGASRRHIVRQLLVESTLLALVGGAVGLLLAMWGADLLLAFRPPLPIDVAIDLRPDRGVFVFAFVLSALTGVLFGLAPALQASRPTLSPALKEGTGGTRRDRLRRGLVVGQVALTLLLLVGAGLFLRGLQRATDLDPGFDAERLVAISFDLGLHGYDEPRGRAYFARVLERVRAVPGVRSAALAEHLPLGFGWTNSGIGIEGVDPGPRGAIEVGRDDVTADYFATMGIPIVRGRAFDGRDRAGAPRASIVNEAFAARYWPGQDPIGKRITHSPGDPSAWHVVVGVARDAKYRTLSEPPRPIFYDAWEQRYSDEVTLVVRVDGAPAAMLEPVRRAAASVDPALPLFEVKTVEEHLAVSLLPVRLASTVLAAFGGLALVLAAMGLYAVMAFAVSQRVREIGVRIAVGARPRDVLTMVVGQGLRLAAVGLVIGIAAALPLTRLVESQLYGASTADPAVYAAIAVLVILAMVAASWLPARRAAAVDPMQALRQD
jgi:macrolide transport system ATP-binding/permease protein